MSSPQQLAPRSLRSAIWVVAFIDEEGEITYLDAIYTDVVDAVEAGMTECHPDQTMKLIQVCLDVDTPGRWADEVSRKVEALVDGSESGETLAIIDQAVETIRDYVPQSVEELSTGEIEAQEERPWPPSR